MSGAESTGPKVLRSRSGVLLTEEVLDRLADEAEAGYGLSGWRRRRVNGYRDWAGDEESRQAAAAMRASTEEQGGALAAYGYEAPVVNEESEASIETWEGEGGANPEEMRAGIERAQRAFQEGPNAVIADILGIEVSEVDRVAGGPLPGADREIGGR